MVSKEQRLLEIEVKIIDFAEKMIEEVSVIEEDEDSSDEEVDQACSIRYALDRCLGVL